MIVVYRPTNIVTGFRPIGLTSEEEAQKYIDAETPDPKRWQVQTETIFDSLDERDWALGIGAYAPQEKENKA